MNMKKFEEFISIGIVKKQTPNKQRALSLIKEVEEKKQFFGVTLQRIPPEEMHSNFIVDSCYDILMELIRAKMFIDGYNAGNSHEAEVSYMVNLGFSESVIMDAKFFLNAAIWISRLILIESVSSSIWPMVSIE